MIIHILKNNLKSIEGNMPLAKPAAVNETGKSSIAPSSNFKSGQQDSTHSVVVPTHCLDACSLNSDPVMITEVFTC